MDNDKAIKELLKEISAKIDQSEKIAEEHIVKCAKDIYEFLAISGEYREIKDFFSNNKDTSFQIKNKARLTLKILEHIDSELAAATDLYDNKVEDVYLVEDILKDFIEIIEYSKALSYIVFKLGKADKCNTNIDNIEFILKRRDQALCTILDLSNYDNEERSKYLILHPFIRNHSECFIKIGNDNWYKIFWALFDHISKQDYRNNTNLPETEITNFISILLKLKKIINSKGFQIDKSSAKEFYSQVIKIIVTDIRDSNFSTPLIRILIEIIEKMQILNKNLNMALPRVLDYIRFGKIDDKTIRSLMKPNTQAPLFED